MKIEIVTITDNSRRLKIYRVKVTRIDTDINNPEYFGKIIRKINGNKIPYRYIFKFTLLDIL